MPSLRFIILLIIIIIQLAGVALAAQLPPSTKCSEEVMKEKMKNPKHLQCLTKYIDIKAVGPQFNAALENTDNKDALKNFVTDICPKVQNAVVCLDAFIDDISECFDGPAERYAFKTVKGMANALIEYLCFDGGNRILEFFAGQGLQCLIVNKDQFQKCVSPKEANLFKMDDIQQGNIPRLNITEEDTFKQCKGIATVSECFLSMLRNKCPSSPYTHTFFDGLLMAVMKKSPCWSTLSKLDHIEPQHYFLAGLVPKHVLSNEGKCPGGESTMDLSVKSINDASVCWNRYLDSAVLMDLGKDALVKGTIAKFLSNSCPKFANVTTCIGQYLDSFKPCITKEDATTLNATKNLVTEFVKFVCNNSGEPVMRFINGSGIECIGGQQNTIETCMKGANVKYFNDDHAFDGDFNSLILQNTWAPQTYSVEECRTVIAFDICVGKAMNTCKDKEPANIVHNLLQAMSKQTPCRDVKLAASASSAFAFCASAILIFHLLLLTKFAGF